MGWLVGAYASKLFEGLSSKPCEALRVINVKVRILDCVEFRALGCSESFNCEV